MGKRVLKRIGWIVFVVLLTAVILVGAYRAIRHYSEPQPAARVSTV